jgi:predicted MFS family arabinose efflux permease
MAKGVLGTALTVLARNAHVTEGAIESLVTARSSGWISGSALGGLLYQRINGHSLMVTAFACLAVVHVLVPLVSNFLALV